jgi:hypothetical protein
LSIAIPVHMKRGIFGEAPSVIVVGTEKTALIRVNKKLYESIVASYKKATYLDRLSGTMHAFSEYADRIAKDPLDQLVSRHPDSSVVDNGDVVSFSLYVGRDERTGKRDDHYSFELRCRHAKYRGSVDKGTNISGKAEFLREVFGERFKME